MAATDDKYKVYVISVSGGAVTIANVEVVVVSGPANTAATTTPVAAAGVVATVGSTAHTDLMAGDKTTITATGTSGVTVMFRDISSGESLGQTTFNVVGPAA